ncbi:MAG: hypothetical protein CVU56_23520 [Deltaproteobacteria bacterium HGW-Deltaproteobacteria-14]|jgi:tetratricopeptide (TPR) repeat protein|nr:MAG: hypothetical protein CVU56_23520 [Deltaproteobacteria bacterium HGW-Deltaproteobacteria-14]
MVADAQDVEAWVELSRAVGYQQRFDEALHWAERSLERYPADADIAAWRVRLLAWSGRLPAARDAYAALVARTPTARDDPETAMLEVDLAFWGRDWRAATDGFTAYLSRFPDDAEALRKRGLAWSERGEVDRAVTDLERSCSLGGQASCVVAEDVQRRGARFSVRLEPGFISEARADLVTTRLEAQVRVVGELRLGLAGELRLRRQGEELLQDSVSTFLASWRAAGFSIEGAVGFGPDADFSPRLSAWIEPSLEVVRDLVWARLRVWRLSFADAGAALLSPALGIELGPVHAEARYFLAFPDEGPSPTHSGVLQLTWEAVAGLAFALGGGGGDAMDSLSAPTVDGGAHWLVLAGVTWEPAWRHEVGLRWVMRREVAGTRAADRHELAVSWRVLF